MIDFELTDEQRLIQETAREFSDREIAPRARDNDRNEHFDTELVQKMADMGFLGAIVPEEYGGRGVDYLTYGVIVEEIVDRPLGHGGAEAAVAAAALLG
jgi:butyryl-CoA dehydrogenase